MVKYSLRVQNFFPLGGVQEANGPPSVNLGAPDISETTIARKLNLKVPLVVKYPHWVQKNIILLLLLSQGLKTKVKNKKLEWLKVKVVAGKKTVTKKHRVKPLVLLLNKKIMSGVSLRTNC